MTDETTPATPQAGGADPINPQPQAGVTPPTDPQAGESQKSSLTAADYERMIADLRKEAAGHRTKLKKFEDEEKARSDAQLTEQQKREKQFAELQKEHADYVLRTQDRIIASELKAHAARLGFADPSDAVAMLNRTELEFDDDGAPTNAEKLLQALLKAKPYLAGKSSAPAPTAGGTTNPARSTSGRPMEITKEYVGQILKGGPQAWNALSPEEQERISLFTRKGGLYQR